MSDFAAARLSIVIPMYNEAENAAPMLNRVHEALAGVPFAWELIVVDDGSSDGTAKLLRQEGTRFGSHVQVVELQRNYGQTAAMQAGIDAARGDYIATLDGDLQNDPADIPDMLKQLIDEDLDLLCGWRKNRQDTLILRKIPSRIANKLIRNTTGVHIHDYGCSLKLYRASIIKQVKLYGEMHRFIPVWAALVTSPSRIGERVVAHHARQFGTSKYGISRTFRVFIDLLSVWFFLRFRARPGHFFGVFGLFIGALGAVGLTYLAGLKLFTGASIGTRPLLLVSVMLELTAVQLITTGVLAELLSRTYYESSDKAIYAARPAEEGEADWQLPA